MCAHLTQDVNNHSKIFHKTLQNTSCFHDENSQIVEVSTKVHCFIRINVKTGLFYDLWSRNGIKKVKRYMAWDLPINWKSTFIIRCPVKAFPVKTVPLPTFNGDVMVVENTFPI